MSMCHEGIVGEDEVEIGWNINTGNGEEIDVREANRNKDE